MLFIVMGFLQHHILDLHESHLRASLILIKLHADISDALLCLRNDNMLQRIYTSSGLLDLRCQKLTGFLDLRQFQHIRKDVSK